MGDFVIRNRLRSLRENACKDQAYIATKIGVARNTYTEYETGATPPPVKALCKIALLYNVSLEYLIGRTINKIPYGVMREYNKDTLRRNVKIIRNNLNFTKEELAKIITCHTRTISRYETGDSNVPLDYIIKLADISHIPIDYIVGIVVSKED